MMRSLFAAIVCASTLVSHVAAHGFVSKVIVGGKSYPGNNPDSQNKKPSPIRSIKSRFPNYGADNKALTCGPGAQLAPLTAEAMPGDEVQFKWTETGNDPFAHEGGPCLYYLAKCKGPCDKFDASNAEWFKFAQSGHKPGKAEWCMNDPYTGKMLSVKLPDNLQAGEYLLRHELIALHLANKPRKAEFYPVCVQLKVGGNKKGVPQSTVKIPGAYKDDHKGLYDSNQGHFYVSDKQYKYPFPGPAVQTLVDGSGNTDPAEEEDDLPTSKPGSTKPPTTTTKSGTSTKPTSATPTTPGSKPTANPNTTPPKCSSHRDKRMLKHNARRSSNRSI